MDWLERVNQPSPHRERVLVRAVTSFKKKHGQAPAAIWMGQKALERFLAQTRESRRYEVSTINLGLVPYEPRDLRMLVAGDNINIKIDFDMDPNGVWLAYGEPAAPPWHIGVETEFARMIQEHVMDALREQARAEARKRHRRMDSARIVRPKREALEPKLRKVYTPETFADFARLQRVGAPTTADIDRVIHRALDLICGAA